MNAVATPTKTAAKKRAAPDKATLTTAADPLGAMFRQLSLHLRNAAFADADGDIMIGHSLRLLRMAASMAGALGGEYWSARPEEAQDAGYDIAALIVAALGVEHDRQGAYALGEIRAAVLVLGQMTGDNDVLEGALNGYGMHESVQPPTPPQERAEPHPLLPGLIGQLRHTEAMTQFAFKGADGGDNPGSTPNGLLDMAAEQIEAIVSDLEAKPALHLEDQTDLLFRLGRFENLIWGAIGAIERECKLRNLSGEGEDFRENTRLEFLDELIENTKTLHEDCDLGMWAKVFQGDNHG